MNLALLAAINTERAARRPAVLVTDTASGAQRLLTGARLVNDPLAEAAQTALRIGKSCAIEHGGVSYFLTVQTPPVRFLAIGAVHITQALTPMMRVANFDMTIIDPRTAFASLERFPDVDVVAKWPDEVLPGLRLDRYTAIALLTHDPKIDDQALVAALNAECFYIGALGSRKTHAGRLERMRARGFSEGQLARIHAPIGLDIGAVSPAEIAVSIIGEIILSLRKKPQRETAGLPA